MSEATELSLFEQFVENVEELKKTETGATVVKYIESARDADRSKSA